MEPVAPNPVTTRELNTTLVLSKDQNVEFKLFDEKGSLLGTLLQPTHYLQGQHQVNLKLPVSKSGIYFIQANLENRILVQKFLVSN
ncbi:MAG: T9SS type A sorting domain-containing protein [Saprospiraceae bacterium]|nr:T9SS type A sorting domain-containing protein [Saprospiraceae bacterium]